MLEYLWAKYEQAKAGMIGYLASFFGLRAQILALRDRARRLLEKAQRTGNTPAIMAARDVAQQTEQLYVDQLAAEQKVIEAKDKIGEVETGKAAGGGLGALPLAALAGAAAVIVTATALILSQFKKYEYLNRVLTDLEKKILTPAEWARAQRVPGMLDDLWPILAAGGAVLIGFVVFSRRRARA